MLVYNFLELLFLVLVPGLIRICLLFFCAMSYSLATSLLTCPPQEHHGVKKLLAFARSSSGLSKQGPRLTHRCPGGRCPCWTWNSSVQALPEALEPELEGGTQGLSMSDLQVLLITRALSLCQTSKTALEQVALVLGWGNRAAGLG
jgi:hypothetical protein